MADWKKLVVSGSNISQLANDAGYLTIVTSPVRNAFASASYNGTVLIADSASGSLAFASGSGQGLTISANATTDTLTFGLSAVPNSSLANSAVTITAGSGLTGGGSTSLGATSTLNIGAGTHITVNTDDVAVNTTTLIPAISGSIFSQVSGDITITPGGVATIAANSVALGTDTTGDYVATVTGGAGLTGAGTGEGSTPTLAVGQGTHITVNADDVAVNTATLIPAITGSIYTGVTGDVTISSAGVATIAANSVALGTDTTGNYVASLGAGTGTTVGGTTGEGSVPTVNVTYGSTSNTAVQGSTTISLTGTANEVEITGTTAQALGAGPSYTIGLPNDVTIGNNLTVTGDLFVNGTTTQVNTSELFIEDKFIILASGSAAAGDGGIIIDRGSDAQGNIAFGFDSATDRWGFQNGLTDSTNAIAIGTDGNSAFVGYVFTEAAHTSAPTSGEFVAAGAIYTATSGDIYIYS